MQTQFGLVNDFCIDYVFHILQEVGVDRQVFEITHVYLNINKWQMVEGCLNVH